MVLYIYVAQQYLLYLCPKKYIDLPFYSLQNFLDLFPQRRSARFLFFVTVQIKDDNNYFPSHAFANSLKAQVIHLSINAFKANLKFILIGHLCCVARLLVFLDLLNSVILGVYIDTSQSSILIRGFLNYATDQLLSKSIYYASKVGVFVVCF